MKTIVRYLLTSIIIFALLMINGCENNMVPQTSGYSNIDNKSVGSGIIVTIINGNGLKIYDEVLPLINIMQLRYLYTDNWPGYVFNYDIPENWNIVFISETISFSCVKNGSVNLNWLPNNYYEFSIITQN